MTRISCFSMVVLVVCQCAVTTTADELPSAHASADEEEIRIMDLIIVSTNRVTVGTNAMSLAAATNWVATHRDAVDMVAVHGYVGGDDSLRTKSAAMAEITRVGIPLLIVEKDGAYSWREQSGADGIRTVKIGTGHFARLRRYWKKGESGPERSSGPVLQTSVDWDTDKGTYELSRVDLGLLGKRVWIMHEQRESDNSSGTVGVQFKKEW